MSTIRRWLFLFCGISTLAAATVVAAASDVPKADAYLPELAYLKQVNSWHPPADPQLLFLLMGQFANANRHAEGAEYIDALRKRFEPRLNDTQRALYLTAIASLRAGAAGGVPLLMRYGWVRDTVRMLDEAKRLTGGEVFVVRWMSGVVRAQLPGVFSERDAALADLSWCMVNADKFPHAGWLREVHFQLAAIQRQMGNADQAAREQTMSGYTSTSKAVTFTTPFSGDSVSGHQFSPRAVREVVTNTVYQLSGFEFTEYYFIVSANRKELIAIDAGTTAATARDAHAALSALVPALPPLTTVFVTHAHWDHVGGRRYFKGLNPALRFIGRANYADDLDHVKDLANPVTLRRFFGQDFRLEDVLAYKPDVAIDHPTEMTIGGSRFSLLPARGGETEDAMMIHLPEHAVLFTGDIMMPYLGAPFVSEGSFDGMLAGIDQVNALQPRLLLHGHEPLTRLFNSTLMLNDLRAQLAWLRDQVAREISRGTPRAVIQQANLIPPTLEQSPSSVHLAYLVLRENVINRLFVQHSGYWQNGMQGLDVLTDADHGAALVDYLKLSESQIISAAERMLADGHHELAAATLRSAGARLPPTERLSAARQAVYLKLMEKNQDLNPFKFIVYGGEIDQSTPRMGVRPGPPQLLH